MAVTVYTKPKSLRLKQAENAYLELLANVASTYNVTILPGDNSDVISSKLRSAGLSDTDVLKVAVELLNGIREVELKGGSWYTLPQTPHQL